MNLRSRYLAGPVAVVSAVAGATLLTLSPASATPSAAHAPRQPAAASSAGRQAADYPRLRTGPATVTGTPSCGVVRSQLPSLARSGLTRVGCASPAPRGASLGVLAPAASSLCAAGQVVRTRHSSCAITTIDYQVLEVPGGKVLGTGTIAVGYKETLNAMSRTWPLDAGIELTHATGVVSTDTTATTDIACAGGCTSSAKWAHPLVAGKAYTHTFTISSPGHGTDVTSQVPVIDVVNPAATDQATPAKLDSLGPARCDSDPVLRQFGKATSGCVFKDVAASYDVYLTGHGEDQIARNVEKGQQAKSLHFGWYGHGRVLFRAPPSVAAKNRRAACGKTRYRKPYSCDEYPFAATYQGAFYFPSQNVTMKVPGTENSAEGGLRSAMYVSERLLYGDSYWVFVLP
ncbi:MAG TPA: hypothetical protein VMG38_20855 [Trebonia sp.]|nr:hypothetical protein [Trebonia sp.]